jgi:phosphatidate cytidylyltransferase
MSEILRRSLTGAVYIILLLSAVFLNSDAFDFLFMTFGLACLYEYKKLVNLRGYHIFAAYLALWWAFIYLVNDQRLINILMVITIIVDVYLLFYLFSKKQKNFSTVQKFIIGLFYIGGGCIFLTMIPYKNDAFAKLLIMGIFILIWVNDSFAYLVGKSIGRTKLFLAVSPKKTIEGTLGGFIFALLAAYIMGTLAMDDTCLCNSSSWKPWRPYRIETKKSRRR